jgi:hypothetical protein
MDINQPCMYVLDPGYHDSQGIKYIKIGTTMNHERRKKDYGTYYPVEARFRYIIILDDNDYSTNDELYKLDKKIAVGLSHIKCYGGGTEWYRDEVDINTILSILSSLNIKVVKVISEHKEVKLNQDNHIQYNFEVAELKDENIIADLCQGYTQWQNIAFDYNQDVKMWQPIDLYRLCNIIKSNYLELINEIHVQHDNYIKALFHNNFTIDHKLLEDEQQDYKMLYSTPMYQTILKYYRYKKELNEKSKALTGYSYKKIKILLDLEHIPLNWSVAMIYFRDMKINIISGDVALQDKSDYVMYHIKHDYNPNVPIITGPWIKLLKSLFLTNHDLPYKITKDSFVGQLIHVFGHSKLICDSKNIMPHTRIIVSKTILKCRPEHVNVIYVGNVNTPCIDLDQWPQPYLDQKDVNIWFDIIVKSMVEAELNHTTDGPDIIDQSNQPWECIHKFFTKALVKCPGNKISATELYKSYVNYANQIEIEPQSQVKFGMVIVKPPYCLKRDRNNKNIYYIDIDIVEQHKIN